MYQAIKDINEYVINRKGPGLLFFYSNLVLVGIKLFESVLLMNGYLQFNPERKYNIQSDTRCYYCGVQWSQHKKSESNNHQFYPSVFLSVTGKL